VDQTNPEPFLPIAEAARFLGVSRAYLYRESPNIEHFKLNGGKFGRLLFRPSALERFASERFVKKIPEPAKAG
jgi:hypothetical protein